MCGRLHCATCCDERILGQRFSPLLSLSFVIGLHVCVSVSVGVCVCVSLLPPINSYPPTYLPAPAPSTIHQPTTTHVYTHTHRPARVLPLLRYGPLLPPPGPLLLLPLTDAADAHGGRGRVSLSVSGGYVMCLVSYAAIGIHSCGGWVGSIHSTLFHSSIHKTTTATAQQLQPPPRPPAPTTAAPPSPPPPLPPPLSTAKHFLLLLPPRHRHRHRHRRHSKREPTSTAKAVAMAWPCPSSGKARCWRRCRRGWTLFR